MFRSIPITLPSPGQSFAPYAQDVDVRSIVPVAISMTLQVKGSSETVTVEAAGEDLLENTSTFHTDVDRGLFDKMPLESRSSSVSSLVTLSSPGIAADSNGLFHGLGDHAENSFSVDGQPITDQQSKVFSNQIPLDSVESLEVISGAPPAEFGDKTSVVINVTTRSGQGLTTPKGSITTSYGSFGTADLGINFGYGGKNWGNFISASGLEQRPLSRSAGVCRNSRQGQRRECLRPRGLSNLHRRLHSFEPGLHAFLVPDPEFLRHPERDGLVRAGGRQWRTRSQRLAGRSGRPAFTDQDVQHCAVMDTCAQHRHRLYVRGFRTPGPVQLLPQRQSILRSRPQSAGANCRPESHPDQRRPSVGYFPREGHSQPQSRSHVPTDVPGREGPSRGRRSHFPRHSVDANGNTCLDANGNPVEAPCTTLAPFDLTRGGTLFPFNGHTDVKELALYAQDTISKGSWSFNLGLRGDFYNGLTTHKEAEPRLGIAYNVKPTNTVLRVSYARVLETPFNENLILSNQGCGNPVLNPLLLCTSPNITPFSPGWRNEFHAGIEQAFGRYVVFSGEYIWKYTHNAYDFSVLGATPITFPIEWSRSKIPGYAGRVSVPNFHGFSALMVFSSVAARFFTPQIGGAGAVPSAALAGGSLPFRIDHDEKFNQTTHLQYQPWKAGPWIGFNWRYDSGLVAGPVPCAGGNCNNGPLGSDTVVDTSIISPDQQFQAGLFCGSVHATPTTPISSAALGANLCPASQYGSTLISIPAPGTEDDDHNPPRISARNLFDIALGDDNLFRGERYKWSLRLSAINITNRVALYNFLSTFSGTHYVTPRALTAELGFHF